MHAFLINPSARHLLQHLLTPTWPFTLSSDFLSTPRFLNFFQQLNPAQLLSVFWFKSDMHLKTPGGAVDMATD